MYVKFCPRSPETAAYQFCVQKTTRPLLPKLGSFVVELVCAAPPTTGAFARLVLRYTVKVPAAWGASCLRTEGAEGALGTALTTVSGLVGRISSGRTDGSTGG